jgi:CRISPR-associated endoribonuclease Cas6
MRLALTFTPVKPMYVLPADFRSAVSAALYRFFEAGSSDFLSWLVDTKKIGPDGRPKRMYNFSPLRFTSYKRNGAFIKGVGPIKIYFSAHIPNQMIRPFIKGIFKMGKVAITSSKTHSVFYIDGVSILPKPDFSDACCFNMSTPAYLSTERIVNGKPEIHYYSAEDETAEAALELNLMSKYENYYGQQYNGPLSLRFDGEWIKEKKDKTRHLIRLRDETSEERNVLGFRCPLEIRAQRQMIELVYDLGIGENTHLGLGYLVLRDKRRFQPIET